MSTIPSARRRVAPACALALCLLLALPPAGPAAAAEVELGAASPEALVARLQSAAAEKDFAELAACLAPDDRAAMSMVLMLGAGMMTAFAQMGAGLAEGMAEMGADLAEGMAEGLADSMGGELAVEGESEATAAAAEAEAEAVAAEEDAEAAGAAELDELAAQAAGMAERYEALLARHGVDELMEQETPPGAAGPEAAAALFAGIDQVALIADLMDFMREEFPDEAAGEEPVPVPAGELSGLTVDGDAAHGLIGGEEVDFVRVDGRWYLDLPDATAEGGEPAEEAPAP
ncbi:MAG TPA: hypothetical protein VHM02_16710 [Thermoanaerobaculia bacterium]|nr:hypothetical protein [Thermoanaerobaculia bacterium]